MDKSLEEQFLEIVEHDGEFLSDEPVASIESLLNSDSLTDQSTWRVPAHFLLGLHYSTKSETDQRIIGHFRAFLESCERPCEKLKVGLSQIEITDLSSQLWAAFAYRHEGTVCRVSTLCGFALDRIAFTHYRNGDCLSAAKTLEEAESDSVNKQNLSYDDDSQFIGWIGWLYFDAGVYDKAAYFLQLCWDSMPQYVEPDSSSYVTNEFVRFTEWYIWYGGKSNTSEIHAFTEMGGHGGGDNFLPSGTLDCGCDAFLLRLAIAHAATGKLARALEAVDLCVKFSEPLKDVHFDVYEDFVPVANPLAKLVRAAISIRSLDCRQAISDLNVCFGQSNELRPITQALLCLLAMSEDSVQFSDAEPLSSIADCLAKASPHQRSRLEDLCQNVLRESLDGTLVQNSFHSDAAEAVAECLQSLTTGTTE